MHDSTRCVHHPAVNEEGYASLAVPTHRASTIVYKDAASFAARKYRGFDGYTYGLHGTPTTRTLEAQLTALHGGVRTVLVPSGQAAVTMVMLAVLMPGDRVLIPDHVYPPVRSFCEDYLKPRGIDYGVYDPLIGRRDEAGLGRVAGLGHDGGAGRARHRQGRQGEGLSRRLRQHLGDAAPLQAAGPWRRFRLRGPDQICRRPFRPAARLDHRRRHRLAPEAEGTAAWLWSRRLAGRMPAGATRDRDDGAARRPYGPGLRGFRQAPGAFAGGRDRAASGTALLPWP